MSKIGRKTKLSWPDEQKQYLIDNFRTVSYPEIARHIGKTPGAVQSMAWKLGLKRTDEEQRSIALKYNTGMIKKGNVSWNKGMKGLNLGGEKGYFPKGNLPHNTKSDGATSIRHKKGEPPYEYIRVAKAKWVLHHRYRWEQEIGPIPKGHMLRCRNGDTLNTDPSNWEMITMAENRNRNYNPEKAHLNGPFHNLSDNYVAHQLTRKEPHLKEEVKKHPELLETARLNMKLNRKIKERNHGTK